MAGNQQRPRRGHHNNHNHNHNHNYNHNHNHNNNKNNNHHHPSARNGPPPPRPEADSKVFEPPRGPRAMQPILPHPSFIQVAKPYVFEHTIQDCLAALAVDPRREDSIRILGVTWIDNVRKALRLPVRTYNTACVYYHKFRLVHPDSQYNYMDAAAAALFTACKIEDTLKKSRDIICAAYNLNRSPSEQVSPDDTIFDQQHRGIIILERLMLEASGFDFRNRHPQKLLVKLAKQHGIKQEDEVGDVAYCISLDLYRTFAPLKQTTGAMAYACLELASRLIDAGLEDVEAGRDYGKWQVGRAEVMETLLDLLDLYINDRASTVVGPDFPVEAFLAIRIPLNKEAEDNQLPRFTNWKTSKHAHLTNQKQAQSNLPNGKQHGNKQQQQHHPHGPSNKGKAKDATAAVDVPPVNPLIPISANGERLGPSDRGRDGTVRFMLDPERAEAEKRAVSSYFKDEMHEVAEE